MSNDTPNDAARPVALYRPVVQKHRHAKAGYIAVMTDKPNPADDENNETLRWVKVTDYDALREEVERLRADRDSWMNQASARVMDWEQQYRRTEAAEASLAKILAEWEPTYRAYHGAFDTPLARRRDGSEFAEDARARMHKFHELLTGALNAQGESNG